MAEQTIQWQTNLESTMRIRTNIGNISAGILLFCLLMLGGSAEAQLPGEGITVQPGRATWTTGFFLEALYSQALEDLGYRVKKAKSLAAPIFYQALVLGDVDYWANGWFPLHRTQLPPGFENKGEIAGYAVKAGALQGYLVSKRDVEKYGITSLEDFKREKVKKAFDANDDGKADLTACPPGWGCEKVISHHLDVYNLRDHIKPIKAGYSAGMAAALARYRQGNPILFYTWTPNWTIYKLKPGKDVMWINVPEIIPTEAQKPHVEAMTQSGRVKGAVTDPIKMGFPANDIAVVAQKQFLKNNPAADKIFELISVPLEDIADQNNRMFEGEDKQRDIERHAREWKAEHEEQWNEWLEKAKAAAK